MTNEFSYVEWHLLYKAVANEIEEHIELLDKIDRLANEQFPIVKENTLCCPICQTDTTVFHMQWEAITCQQCKAMIDKDQWLNLETVKLQ